MLIEESLPGPTNSCNGSDMCSTTFGREYSMTVFTLQRFDHKLMDCLCIVPFILLYSGSNFLMRAWKWCLSQTKYSHYLCRACRLSKFHICMTCKQTKSPNLTFLCPMDSSSFPLLVLPWLVTRPVELESPDSLARAEVVFVLSSLSLV